MTRYFKYLSTGAARATVKNQTLRWSRPSRFNDLFDMAVPYATEVNKGEVVERAIELIWKRAAGLEERSITNTYSALLDELKPTLSRLSREDFDAVFRTAIEEALAGYESLVDALSREVIAHLSRVKVLCLSTTNDDNTMWGLYAENHSGLVLEFTNADGQDSVFRLARPVEYRDAPPRLLSESELAELLAGNLNLSPSFADVLIYMKSSHWRYERELRLATGEGRHPDEEFEDLGFHQLELKSVFYGARSSSLREELDPVFLDKYPHVERWQAQKGEGFKISFDLLDPAKKGSPS